MSFEAAAVSATRWLWISAIRALEKEYTSLTRLIIIED
jgi:hypothetical protein